MLVCTAELHSSTEGGPLRTPPADVRASDDHTSLSTPSFSPILPDPTFPLISPSGLPYGFRHQPTIRGPQLPVLQENNKTLSSAVTASQP